MAMPSTTHGDVIRLRITTSQASIAASVGNLPRATHDSAKRARPSWQPNTALTCHPPTRPLPPGAVANHPAGVPGRLKPALS